MHTSTNEAAVAFAAADFLSYIFRRYFIQNFSCLSLCSQTICKGKRKKLSPQIQAHIRARTPSDILIKLFYDLLPAAEDACWSYNGNSLVLLYNHRMPPSTLPSPHWRRILFSKEDTIYDERKPSSSNFPFTHPKIPSPTTPQSACIAELFEFNDDFFHLQRLKLSTSSYFLMVVCFLLEFLKLAWLNKHNWGNEHVISKCVVNFDGF